MSQNMHILGNSDFGSGFGGLEWRMSFFCLVRLIANFFDFSVAVESW